jgi:preprotein translocase subunit YajC
MLQTLLNTLGGKWIQYAIMAVIFWFLQPRLIELIDSMFINLASLGIEAENHLQVSNFVVFVVIALVFWLMKSPREK